VVGRNGICRVAAVALVVAAMTVTAAVAQERHHHGRHAGAMHGVSTLSLLGNEAVQKELALRPEQSEKVHDLLAEVHAEWKQQMQAARETTRGQENSSGEDRPHRSSETRSNFAGISKSVNEKFRGKVAEILDGAQQTRLREIAIQISGSRAFQDADVVRELGLTNQQQEQLAAVRHEYAEKFAEMWHEGSENSGGENGAREHGARQDAEGGRHNGEGFAKMHELRQEEMAKSISVLNPEQQARFATMKGKPFDLAQLHQAHHRHHGRGNSGRSA
jgi:Spy/CpxP family protein refolding chaperone